MLERRRFLTLLGSLPIVASGIAGSPARSAPPPYQVLRAAATAARSVSITRWKANGTRKGTIAFSHGYGSSPRFYPAFTQAWTDAGYEVIAPLHVDSREYPNQAAFGPADIWAARIQDMRAVAALVEGPYVAAGHSFGALNALVLGGAEAVVPSGVQAPLEDTRVQAVIAFSPPPPNPALITAAGYGKVARPALIQTGTLDVPPSVGPVRPSWQGHLTAFSRSAPTNDHYALVLEGVDHYFGGLICDSSKSGPDQRRQLQLATLASLAMLDRYAVKGPAAAKSVPNFPVNPAARIYRR